jgi:hypothetical protein
MLNEIAALNNAREEGREQRHAVTEVQHQLLEETKENDKMLDQCKGPHEFVPWHDDIINMYKCNLCGGIVSAIEKKWYENGIKHGRDYMSLV